MERLRKLALALAVAILFASIPASAQNLCPPPKPLPEGVDDLRMVEGDFTFSKAIESLRWLEKDVWDVIREHKTTEELMMSTARFGIPFPNSVSRIKGVLLHKRSRNLFLGIPLRPVFVQWKHEALLRQYRSWDGAALSP